jgi:hypothetical protein
VPGWELAEGGMVRSMAGALKLRVVNLSNGCGMGNATAVVGRRCRGEVEASLLE